MDTSNILFICGGAFAGLEKVIAQRGKGMQIGFGADVKHEDERSVGEMLKDLEPDDLVKFGLIPEFIGRLPVIATIDDLDESALVEILTQPKNALVKQYKTLFEMESVELDFTEDALEAIAKKAIKRKSGARGLRSIMEALLLDPMFEMPGTENELEKMVINKEAVEGTGEPLCVYTDHHRKKTKKKSAKA